MRELFVGGERKMSAATQLSERRLDEIIGILLRTGVLIAAFFVLTGGVLYLVRENGPVPDYHVFHGEPQNLRTVSGIVYRALELRGRGLIQLGLLILIATPIARVAFSLLVFLYERDWIYVAVTVIVLGLLLYSLLGRHA
jgi:uncharacterized membrane protein